MWQTYLHTNTQTYKQRKLKLMNFLPSAVMHGRKSSPILACLTCCFVAIVITRQLLTFMHLHFWIHIGSKIKNFRQPTVPILFASAGIGKGALSPISLLLDIYKHLVLLLGMQGFQRSVQNINNTYIVGDITYYIHIYIYVNIYI